MAIHVSLVAAVKFEEEGEKDMYIKNATDQSVRYDISSPGAGDCGTIDPHGVVSLPYYDSGYSSLSLSPLPNGYFQLINGPKNAIVTLSLTVASVSAAEQADLDKQSKK